MMKVFAINVWGVKMMAKKCHYCDSEETKYCVMCRKWFCDHCRKQYGKRLKDMVKEKVG